MIVLFILAIACSQTSLLHAYNESLIYRTGASQKTNYPAFCKLASEDNAVFSTFRKNINFVDVVETLSYELGLEFAKAIVQRYPHLLPYCSKISQEDSVGGPIQRLFSSLGLWFSPTTLRYIKIAGDLEKEFGSLKNFNIVEIGGGCGGQCKVLHDTTGFASYTIIDLPETTLLINKFLSTFNIQNIQTIANSQLTNSISSDLVISNYAFSEIDTPEQLYYIVKVIQHAPRGYMIYNLMPPVNPLSLNEFAAILSLLGKKVRIERENPLTGDHNYVIIWHPA